MIKGRNNLECFNVGMCVNSFSFSLVFLVKQRSDPLQVAFFFIEEAHQGPANVQQQRKPHTNKCSQN